MKRNYIIILAVIAVVLVALTPMFIGMRSVFKKFDELSAIQRIDSVFVLPKSTLAATNVQSGSVDTITFTGIKILNFWASWCKPCIAEIPSLQTLQAAYPRIEIKLISFDSLNSLKQTIEKNKWTLPAYRLVDTSVFKTPQVLPMTYILTNDSVVKVVYGYENWISEKMKNYVDSIVTSK